MAGVATGDASLVRTRSVALLGVVVISFAAIVEDVSGASPSTAAFFRAFYALPVLALLAWWRSRHPEATRRPPRARWMAFGAGALLGVDLTLWHHSIGLMGAGLATVLANLQVVIVGALAWVLLGERPPKLALLAVPVALVGVVLTSGVDQAGAYGSNPGLGAILALGAAATYAGFLLLFRNANAGVRFPAGPLFDATGGAAAAALILVPTDPAFTFLPPWPMVGWLVVYAVGVHTLGWLAITRALPRLPALATSLLLLVQPVLTMLWAALLLAEAPSLLQWFGVVLVLGAVASASLGDRTAGAGEPA